MPGDTTRSRRKIQTIERNSMLWTKRKEETRTRAIQIHAKQDFQLEYQPLAAYIAHSTHWESHVLNVRVWGEPNNFWTRPKMDKNTLHISKKKKKRNCDWEEGEWGKQDNLWDKTQDGKQECYA